mmetsp:Transcript_81982/g.162814  ORF Transcript_81982/g.162814 Transcript_81982/m.162814 type:complete len:170 (+) Transcript_81982:96-605(+)
MIQIFRIVLFTVLCLVNCRSASIMQKGCVLAPGVTLPLLLSLVPAALSSDAGEDAAGASDDGAGGADEQGGEDFGDMEGTGADEESDGGEETQPQEIMKDMDLDKDGFLSLSEVVPEEEGLEPKEMEEMKKVFVAADGDKDGKLSLDEIPAMIKAFESMDEGEGASEEM